MSKDRLPVLQIKLPGQPVKNAGIMGTAVDRDGMSGSLAQGFDITYADGKNRQVVRLTAKGLIGKHVRGVGADGAQKIDLPAASTLTDAQFFVTYPHTGTVKRLTGKYEVTEKNGLTVTTLSPYPANDPAKTGVGQHVLTLRMAEAKIRAVKVREYNSAVDGKDAIDAELYAELLAALDGQTASTPASTTPADGQPVLTPESVGAATN